MKATHILLAALLALPASAQTKLTKAQRQAGEAEATAVINRFMGGQNQDALPLKVKVQLTLPKTADGRDSYSYTYSSPKADGAGTLTIKASDGVAACRGFYDFVKSKGAGICSWSGNRFDASAINSTSATSQLPPYGGGRGERLSPFRDHQYMNVVTYGYTAPYWDEARWDQELDWMALHGIDMPLLLIAQEQVYREVFMDMGLTKEEIDAWEVGPAHLPWMRMGNLSGNSFDGPLGEGWNDTQVKLCRHVIERMRRLGMKPICPAFGGFVPKTFVDHYDGEIDYTGWDWVPKDTRNYRLNPGSKAFAEVGTRFIRKWEEKFGKCTYYLSDSFNEMEIPQDKALMTSYGDAIYKSIRDANPDAVWTMQGWTVGFQRGSWGNGIFEALVKNVPDDRFMLLDMATDYNKTWWGSTYNWDEYPKFYGKEWVWSTIPNMGGKTAFTGVIDYYANGRLDAQNSPNRGNLTGYGVAAEGVENNEIIYELIADAGWTGAKDSIDVDAWLADYARCRYGDFTAQDKAYYDAMRKSVYNGFRDHPQFAWQVRNNIIGRGSVQVNADFYAAVEALFADPQILKDRYQKLQALPLACKGSLPNGEGGGRGLGGGGGLYQADLIEAAAMYTSGKIEEVNSNIRRAVEADNRAAANELLGQLSALMLHLDRALTAHPLYNIEVWEQKAMDLAANEADRKRNAVNARRIVSVWYGDHQKDEPVNDYACRIWAGLIRDYYLPRLIGTWNRRINGIPFDQIAFENSFVEKAPALSPQQPLADADVIDYLAHLVAAAKQMASGAIDDGGDQQMQNWRDMFFKDGI